MDSNFDRRHRTTLGPGLGADLAPLARATALDFFHGPSGPSNRELNLRMEERRKERARIARDLHDTLFQGVLGASLVLFRAVEEMPPDYRAKPALERALLLMRRAIDEGRHALDGLRSSAAPTGGLERTLAGLADELATEGPRFRISVIGRPKVLHPAVDKEIYLIAREAMFNSLRHSSATYIETDVEYLPSTMRVVVRDNGSGIDPEVLRAGRASHWGLLGMRERAESIGAQLRIWSRRGTGTEVEISIPMSIAVRGPLEEKVQPLGSPRSELAAN